MFTVPIIPPDLRHEETIVQAAHALCCLEKTIFKIFDRLDERIEKNDGKIQEMKIRIGRVQEKINGLIGTKKSIKIYAPSRFPGTQILRNDDNNNIPQTFAAASLHPAMAERRNHEDSEAESRCQSSIYKVNSPVDAPTPQSSKDKLIFFHVRTMNGSQQSVDVAKSRSAVNQQQQGLGELPQEIRSVTSALRFGSDDFAYDSTTSSSESRVQALLFKRKRRQAAQTQHGGQHSNLSLQLAPAPHSFTNREQRAASRAGSWHYTPRLNNVPDLNLPRDLPDLPDVANDVQFVGEEEQNIAPSMLIENLPDLEELEQEQDIEERPSTIPSVTPVMLALAPPPPPPPPPPPQPPIPPPPPPSNASLQVQLSQTSNRTETSDTHSELMAAIRSAGGTERANLRRAAAAKNYPESEELKAESDRKKSEPSSSAGAGGGLMAELHNKLMLRRKGISGAKEHDNDDGSSIRSSSTNPLLSNLSSLIPQTAMKRAIAANDDEDDDDDDSNDNEWVD